MKYDRGWDVWCIYTLSDIKTPYIPSPVILHPPAYEDGADSVPKRRLLDLRRRGITQKKHITVYFCFWFRASLINIIIAERDATKRSLFIILQVHSTCFGCQPHS